MISLNKNLIRGTFTFAAVVTFAFAALFLNSNSASMQAGSNTIVFDRYDSAVQYTKVFTMNADGTNVMDLGRGFDPVWSPDGTKIAYAQGTSETNDIWIMNADGLNRAQLTTSRGNDHWPSVTPDGRVVVFVSERDGGRGLWRMDIEGGRQQRLVAANVGQRPQLSADGKDVYYGDTALRQSFRVSIDGGTPTPLPLVLAGASGAGASLPEGFHEAAPSPDGKLISGHYNDAAQRGERMTVITPGHPEATLLLPTVPVPAQWSPDGRSLLYIDTRRGVSNLWRHPVGGGAAAAQITKFTNDRIFRYALSRDQKRWAIVRGEISRDVVLVSERK